MVTNQPDAEQEPDWPPFQREDVYVSSFAKDENQLARTVLGAVIKQKAFHPGGEVRLKDFFDSGVKHWFRCMNEIQYQHNFMICHNAKSSSDVLKDTCWRHVCKELMIETFPSMNGLIEEIESLNEENHGYVQEIDPLNARDGEREGRDVAEPRTPNPHLAGYPEPTAPLSQFRFEINGDREPVSAMTVRKDSIRTIKQGLGAIE
eukprot:CAMPEP_0194037102 /NCGR_PEP_ID=MMETSP0009_2-20130614/9450_1 /TAXON_ID=210454 /ORGANISM="Grammatophora oceanica, Strain CCMP 410" /LENGTH=204 /DNA_ID=CAMNT_0038679125 /DNA_START=33 /DNA_END=648 /DNA_ORIENTATION=-